MHHYYRKKGEKAYDSGGWIFLYGRKIIIKQVKEARKWNKTGQSLRMWKKRKILTLRTDITAKNSFCKIHVHTHLLVPTVKIQSTLTVKIHAHTYL